MSLLKSQISILTELNNSYHSVRIQNFTPEAIRIVNKCQAFHFLIIRFLYTLDSQFFKPFISPLNIRSSNFNVTKSPRARTVIVVTLISVSALLQLCVSSRAAFPEMAQDAAFISGHTT